MNMYKIMSKKLSIFGKSYLHLQQRKQDYPWQQTEETQVYPPIYGEG